MDQYTETTKEFVKTLTKQKKSEQGIFFTPKSVRDKLVSFVNHAQNILEPSCGSGEIISELISKYPSAHIMGVELDQEMANLCNKTYPSANIINHDFLTWKSNKKFDFIIGNPPFVVQPAGYKSNPAVVKGRSNLYVEFLYKCLTEHLADDGILAFVIPSTIGNSVYYEPIRKLITTKDILAFEILEKHDFCDTNTRLCILVIKNSSGSGRHVYEDYIITGSISKPERTLGSLNLTYKTGFCWANVSKFFVDKSDIPFFTCGNIKLDEICVGPKTKYLSKDSTKFFTGKALMVRTASGGKRGGKFELGFALYDGNKWGVDNDVIVIQGPDINDAYNILKKSETLDFIKMLVNNAHISMKLLKLIPM